MRYLAGKAYRDFVPNLSYVLIFFFSISLSYSVYAVEVGEISYKGFIGELMNKSVPAHEKIVAYGPNIRIKKPDKINKNVVIPPAIFFIIDNSSSMSFQKPKNDQMGSRFRVTRDLIDTIRAKFGDEAEVGLAIFQRELVFRPEADPRFKTAEAPYDTGAYIPLVALNKKMDPDPDGKTGYDFLKHYLDTTLLGPDTAKYVALKYKPNPPWPDDFNPYTNINIGFEASKAAFKKSKYAKSRHFNIFLSDGAATWPPGPSSNKDQFKEGKDVATTFTVFFTENGTPVASITEMTENIRKNGYSEMNDSSRAYAIQTDYETLMALLTKKILSIMSLSIESNPDTLQFAGLSAVQFNNDKQQFEFGNLFPLMGRATDFDFTIRFSVIKDSVVNNVSQKIKKDSVVNGKFTVLVQEGAKVEDTFSVRYWDRDVGFFHNTNKITQANEKMTSLDLRFTYSPGQVGYNYSNAKISVSTVKSKDHEEFTLQKNDKTFSKSITHNLVFTSSVTSDNGILETYSPDTIQAVFRNTESTKLPLDTLMIRIPVKFTGLTLTFVQKATSPSYLKFIEHNKTIPQDIYSILTQQNKKECEVVTKDDGCHGMLLQITPDKKLSDDELKALEGLSVEGKVTIFDALGTIVLRDKTMGFNPVAKNCNYVWNFRNDQGRLVGEGAYLAVFNYTAKYFEGHKGNKDTKRLIIALRRGFY